MASPASIKKNLIYNVAYQILNIMLPLVTAPYVSRVLGAESLGIYNKSQALAHYFLLFSMLGVNNYGNRAIARVRGDRTETSKTFWEIYSFQVMIAVFSLSIYVIYSTILTAENKFVYLVQAFYVLSGVIDVNWFCFGLEKFRLTTVRSTIIRITMMVAILLFVNCKNDLWLYALIISLGSVISCISVWPFIVKQIDWIKPSWEGIKRHIKPNLILFWPVVAVSIYNVMDKLMLGMYCASEEVAYYSNAERIVTIPTTLILALDNAIMPRMSNLFAKKAQKEKIVFLMDTVMLFAMFMASAMCFGLAGISDRFAPWFFGDEYVRCGFFILLLSPVVIIKAWAGALRTQFIIPTGRDKVYVVSLTIGAIVNLAINLLLIPSMQGVGAIIGTIAAEFAVCFLQFFWCRKEIHLKSYMIDGLSFCVIGAVMFVLIKIESSIPINITFLLVIQIVSGALIYILLASAYMIYIKKNPVLINEGLKLLRLRKRINY